MSQALRLTTAPKMHLINTVERGRRLRRRFRAFQTLSFTAYGLPSHASLHESARRHLHELTVTPYLSVRRQDGAEKGASRDSQLRVARVSSFLLSQC